MLSEKMAGGEPDFQGFMQKYGDLFGQNPPQTLDELIEQMQQGVAAMQSLLESLPSDMRQQLQDLMMDKVGDPELQRELMELQMNLDIVAPGDDLENQYPFRGDEGLDLLQAMRLMENLQDMDDLEKQLEKTQYGGNLDDIDEEKLREMLGEEAGETLKQLKDFLEILEEAGLHPPQGQPLGTDARAACVSWARRRWARSTPSSRSRTTASTSSVTTVRAESARTRRRRTNSVTRSTCTWKRRS